MVRFILRGQVAVKATASFLLLLQLCGLRLDRAGRSVLRDPVDEVQPNQGEDDAER